VMPSSPWLAHSATARETVAPTAKVECASASIPMSRPNRARRTKTGQFVRTADDHCVGMEI
jgi:hypothetical protein